MARIGRDENYQQKNRRGEWIKSSGDMAKLFSRSGDIFEYILYTYFDPHSHEKTKNIQFKNKCWSEV